MNESFVPILIPGGFKLISLIATISFFSSLAFMVSVALYFGGYKPTKHFKRAMLILGLLSIPIIVGISIAFYNTTFGFSDWSFFAHWFEPSRSCSGV